MSEHREAGSSPATAWLALRCESCGAELMVEPGHRTTRCPYCAAPAVIERPAGQRVDPRFVLGFVTTEAAARACAKAFVSRAWLAPTAFRRAGIEHMRGIYVPAFLYTAAAQADYRASIGENYTVVETYTTTDSKGRVVTRTRTVVKTEWRSLQGSWAAYVDDVIVTASRGLPNADLERIEPYDFRALRAYTPKVLSGWVAEDPSIASTECLVSARAEARAQVGRRLARHMPGDSHRELEFEVRLEHESIELVLVPVWVLAVRYRPDVEPVRLVINGQTGAVTGRPPKSWVKITALVVAVLVIIAIAVGLGSLR